MTTQNQEKIEPKIGIDSDLPKSDPDFDEFGYAEFARLIASAAASTASPQGLVMAINGPWGAGKSTLLNFVKHFLTRTSGGESTTVIEFNPWWFEDRSQLASQFLAQFGRHLKVGPSNIQRLGDLMAQYSEALGKAVALSTGHPWVDKPVGALLKLFKLKPKDIPVLKAEISKILRAEGKRYVFIIDDVDRLMPDEIREVFKVIKALADFPNVVYLLSFDRAVVAEALNGTMGLDGDAYLEKIVQAPFELPQIPTSRLHRKLFSELDKVLEGSDLELFDQGYWTNIFVEGLGQLIKRPRDVVRYVNSLSVTFPPLRNEVSFADFAALECLRVFLPSLYATIRNHPQHFSGRSEQGIGAAERERERAFHQAWADSLDPKIRDGIQAMLERMFPRLSSSGHDSGFLASWRKQRRAASPDLFPTFFSFGMPTDRLSRQALLAFIEGLSNPEESIATLRSRLKETRPKGDVVAMEYLSQMTDFDEEIDSGRAKNLLKVISVIGDQIILNSSGNEGVTFVNTTWRICYVLQHALAKIQESERNETLVSQFNDCASPAYLCSLISWIQSAHKKRPSHGPAVVLLSIAPDTIEVLKQVALAKIQLLARDNSLLEVPELLSVLYRWRDWDASGEHVRWAKERIEDPRFLTPFLTAFLHTVRTSSWGDAVWQNHQRLHFKDLATFVDLDKVAELLSAITNEELLPEKERLAVDIFKRHYPLFKDGKEID